jgi:hypothetical protein
MTMLAAAGLALAPVAAHAAASLSVARAAAPMVGASFLQDADDNDDHGSTAVILGVVLVVLIGVAAVSGNGHENPTSP